MYSAVKVNGKRLYEYARAGIEVERPIRNVTIYKIELLEDWDSLSGHEISFRFKVDCSKGTYIRTLAVMIGEKLGYPAHMSDLSRTRSATMTLDDCLTLEQIEEAQSIGVLEQSLRPIEDALSYLPKYEINDTLAMRVRNGAVLEAPPHLMDADGPIAVFSEEGEALAIYIHHPSKEGMIKPSKILKVLE